MRTGRGWTVRSGPRAALARAACGAERLLVFAAAPAFAALALAVAHDRNALGGLCSASGGSHLVGMATMYGAMCLAHLGPWLRLLRQGDAPAG